MVGVELVMKTNNNVWRGLIVLSAALILFSSGAAAWEPDDMQADMEDTFDDKFGSEFDAQMDQAVDQARTAQRTEQFDRQVVQDDESRSQTVDRDVATDVADGWSESAAPTAPVERSDDSDYGWGEPGTTTESSADGDSIDSNTGDSGNSGSSSSTGSSERQAEQYLHEMINEERTSRGLSPLDMDSGLQSTAQQKSQDMARNDYFSHTSPSGEGFRDLYNKNDVQCSAGGENIAKTWDKNSAKELADGIRDQWMSSSSHRDAILRSRYSSHGLGIEITDDGQVYATEHFC